MSDMIQGLKWKLINWLAGYSVGEEMKIVANSAYNDGFKSGLAQHRGEQA
jgi:hypothetical protein